MASCGLGQEGPLNPDDIYRQIGLAVVAFQSLENVLVQICWLLTDPPYAADARRALARLSFSELVTESGKRVDALAERDGFERTDFRLSFVKSFHEQLTKCRNLARQRNRVVHSAYLHLEGCGELVAVMRSYMHKAANGPDVDFDQEVLTPTSFDVFLREIAVVAFALSQGQRQLVAWVPRGPGGGGSPNVGEPPRAPST